MFVENLSTLLFSYGGTMLKTQIRVFCQCFKSFSTSMNKIHVSLLETEILQLERKLAESQNGWKIQLLLEKKKAYLRELNHERVMGMSVRLRIQNMKFSDTPTKSFFSVGRF